MKMHHDIPCWGDPLDEGALAQAVTCRKTGFNVAIEEVLTPIGVAMAGTRRT
jgi:hypothetical protein